MNELARKVAAENPQLASEIRAAWQRGEPGGWFETVYQRARDEGLAIPWFCDGGHPLIREWLAQEGPAQPGQRALVIGCGYGDDAELLAEFGYSVAAFDIAATAIAACRARFPHSSVAYRVADLFDLPAAWQGAFHLALESRTLQALPWQELQPAVRAIRAAIAPGGRLLVIAHAREEGESRHGIPWPLARSDLAEFRAAGLTELRFEDIQRAEGPRLFRVAYRLEGATS